MPWSNILSDINIQNNITDLFLVDMKPARTRSISQAAKFLITVDNEEKRWLNLKKKCVYQAILKRLQLLY